MSIREKILETMRGRLVFRNEKHVTQKNSVIAVGKPSKRLRCRIIKSDTIGDTILSEREQAMNELDNTFAEIAKIIEEARDNAHRKVNEELILMYRRVGQFLSEKSKEANYGDGYIDSLADHIQEKK